MEHFIVNVPLHECVTRLKQAKKTHSNSPYEWQDKAKITIKQITSDSYSFEIKIDSKARLYGSTIIQAKISGLLERENEQNTKVTYEKQILWGFTLFIYIFAFGMWAILTLSISVLLFMLGCIVITVTLVLERQTGLAYIEDLPLYLKSILRKDTH